jgi:DNA modification methylase
VISILDRLNVAVIELTEDLSHISFTNVAGFEFLKSAYQQSKNLNEEDLPPLLQKN